MEPKKTADLDIQTTPDGRIRDVEELEQFFAYEHLPPHLREVSEPFGKLAAWIIDTLPRNRQRTNALNDLLSAKDCAVRSRLTKP